MPSQLRTSPPTKWTAVLAQAVRAGEETVAWFETDLDLHQCYGPLLLVLTTERFLVFASDHKEPLDQWARDAVQQLHSREQHGLGNLRAIGIDRQLGAWRYTAAEGPAAARFVQACNTELATQRGERLDLVVTVCPSCGAVLSSGESECPSCAVTRPPEARSLLRLWRFAKPHLWLSLLGLLLTIAGTTAALIGPYLTMHLLDDVLIPQWVAGDVKAPALPSQNPATVSELLVQPGDQVAKGQVVSRIESDGALVDVPSPVAGPVTQIDVQPGDTLNDGQTLLHISAPLQPRFVQLVAFYLSGLLGAAVLAWLLSWGRSYVLSWVSEEISADIRNSTYSHLQRLSLEFFGGKRTGDLISRISSDSDRICNFLSTQLVDFVNDVLNIVMTSIALLAINPLLALVTLIPFPAIAWLSQLVRSRLRHGYALGGRAWSEMVSVLADTIPGIRVVKAFAQEHREIQRFQQSNVHVVEANDRVNRIWSFFTPVITLLTEVGLLVIWAFGAWLLAGGSLRAGVLVAFVQYIGRFYARLDSMSRMLAATQRAASATHRIFEILDRNPSVAEPVKPVHPERLRGRIELKGVRFAYGPREVIKGVDLIVEPGEMIGLVGPSGAGKSTLVNLVCRFFDVASGAIFVDGHDIRSFPIEEYRRNIGIVLQDPFLFYGTIAENIAYGRPAATRREVIEAAKAAKAHEFILRLTDGYDSIVGERGQALSGGERQRISIARALLTDPRILILDEATSSVDTETEREIQGALDNLTRGRTTIAIAHRLSTLRNASRIVVMEQGQITEVGGHDELLLRAGTYARLHAVQQVDPKAAF